MLALAVTDAQKVSYCRALHPAKPLHSESGSGKSDPDSPAHHDESTKLIAREHKSRAYIPLQT